MALSYIVDPLIEHQNRAGVNNVDGWFEVFLQDTDDHAEVYLDFAGTRAPEQIRIDNNGRAVMIAEENVLYRVEMYDATGNLIYTQYPVYTMASGGGQLVTNLESTNGTVKVNRTAVGSTVNYDLSVMDNDMAALPWLRCSGSTPMSGDVYRPEYVEGVMDVGSRGIVLRGGQYYHVDVHAQCTKGSPVEYYDTVTVELVKEGEEDTPVTVASTAWVVDCTTSSTESVGLSADVMANADCELVVKITPTLANQNTFALTDVSAHRVYTGLPWRTEGGGLELGETATTAYRGDRGKAAYDHSLVTSGNPHNVTKGDVGLGNVENKSSATLKSEFTGAVTEGGTGFPTGGDVYTALSGKVDKEQGKGLSTNDFTDSLKTKLDNITVGSVASGDTGFPTGGDVYTAIDNNGKGIAVFEIQMVDDDTLPSTGLPTYNEIETALNAGKQVFIDLVFPVDPNMHLHRLRLGLVEKHKNGQQESDLNFRFSGLFDNCCFELRVYKTGSVQYLPVDLALENHYHEFTVAQDSRTADIDLASGTTYLVGAGGDFELIKTPPASDVAYDGTAKKLTKTVDGTTSDVVTAATLKTDMALDNVDNKSSATLKSEFTGSVAQNDTGFPTGGDVYTAIVNNGQGIAAFDITLVSGALPSTGLPTFAEVNAKRSAGYNVLLRVKIDSHVTKIYDRCTYYANYGVATLTFYNNDRINADYIRVFSDNTWSMGSSFITDKMSTYNMMRGAQDYDGTNFKTISTWDLKNRIAVVTYMVRNNTSSTKSVRIRQYDGTNSATIGDEIYADIPAYGVVPFTFAIDTRTSQRLIQVKSNTSTTANFIIWSSGFGIDNTL